jgi:Leucine rich repeat/Leucine Rich repeat
MRLSSGLRFEVGCALCLCCALCLAPYSLVTAQAPARPRGSTFSISAVRIDLLRHESVQTELRLKPEQVQKAKALLADHDREFWEQMRTAGVDLAGFQGFRSGERVILFDELAKRVDDIGGKTDDKFAPRLSELLDAGQRHRLDEIALQAAGNQALLDPTIAKTLALNEVLQERESWENLVLVAEITVHERYGEGTCDERLEQLNRHYAKADQDVLVRLTPDQRNEFQQMRGRPFSFDWLQPRGAITGPKTPTVTRGPRPMRPQQAPPSETAKRLIAAMRLGLLRFPGVRQELHLKPEQSARTERLLADRESEFSNRLQTAGVDLADFHTWRPAQVPIKFEKLNELVAELSTRMDDNFGPRVATILDAGQVGRLEELALQAAGSEALEEPATAASLAITTAQKRRLAFERQNEFSPIDYLRQAQGVTPNRLWTVRRLYIEYDDLALARLTDDQKQKWKQRTGARFDFRSIQAAVAPSQQRDAALPRQMAESIINEREPKQPSRNDLAVAAELSKYGAIFDSPGNTFNGVSFRDMRVPDAALLQLGRLDDLELLTLDGAHITDAGLAYLDGLAKLVNLNLGSNQFTDAGMAHLARCTNLVRLSLFNNQITDAGLVHLKDMTKLFDLNLAQTKVRGPGLVHFKRLSAMVRLSLVGTEVSDEGLAHVGEMSNLRSLYLSRTHVAGPGLAQLKGCKKLTDLSLSGTRLTDTGLAKLADLPQLQSLDLSGTAVTDAGLAELGGFTNLRRLSLNTTKVTKAGVQALRRRLPKCTIFE